MNTSLDVAPVSETIALRAMQSKFRGGSLPFRMTEPRQRENGARLRLQEAINRGDGRTRDHGVDPGRYNPKAPRTEPVSVFIPSEGPGDARARLEREAVKRGALLDTAPPFHMPPVKRPPTHNLELQDSMKGGFGVRTPRWDHRSTQGPAPGSYDIPSAFERPKPALARSFAMPLTRSSGPHGTTWMPVKQYAEAATPKAAAKVTPRSLSSTPRKVTVLSVETDQAELRKK